MAPGFAGIENALFYDREERACCSATRRRSIVGVTDELNALGVRPGRRSRRAGVVLSTCRSAGPEPLRETRSRTGLRADAAPETAMRRFRTMNTQLLHHMHELHSRISDGIHVRLLWSKQDDRVAVAVDGAKTGDAFTVDVRNGDRALDVFHHPYAYAALRGIDTRALVAASRDGAPARVGARGHAGPGQAASRPLDKHH